MKITFTEYIYPEDYNFQSILNRAGHPEIDGDEVSRILWEEGGTRELAVELELDTETGIIKVVGQE